MPKFQISRRNLLQMAGLSGVGLALSACGGGSTGDTELSADPSATFPAGNFSMYGYGNPQALAISVEDYLATIPERANGVTFEVVQNQGEDAVRQRVVTGYASGATEDLADVIMTGAPSLVSLAQSGALMDVSEFANARKDKMVDGALNDTTVGGKVFALPLSVRPQLLFYNEDLLVRHDIDPESLDTFAGYADAGRKLLAATGGKTKLSYIDPGSLTWRYWGRRGLMPQAGATIWADDGSIAIGEDEGTKLALGYLDELNTDGLLYKATPMQPPLYDAIANEEVATFYIGAFWDEFLRPNVAGLSGKWRVRSAPVFDEIGTRGAPVTQMFALINKKDPKYANLFSEWWDYYTFDADYRNEYTQRMIDQTLAFNPPVSKDVLATDFWSEGTDYYGGQSFRAMEGEALQNPSKNLRLTEDDPQADQIISVELEKYVAGDQTMDQAIANMAANLQSQIGQTDPAA